MNTRDAPVRVGGNVVRIAVEKCAVMSSSSSALGALSPPKYYICSNPVLAPRTTLASAPTQDQEQQDRMRIGPLGCSLYGVRTETATLHPTHVQNLQDQPGTYNEHASKNSKEQPAHTNHNMQ